MVKASRYFSSEVCHQPVLLPMHHQTSAFAEPDGQAVLPLRLLQEVRGRLSVLHAVHEEDFQAPASERRYVNP